MASRIVEEIAELTELTVEKVLEIQEHITVAAKV